MFFFIEKLLQCQRNTNQIAGAQIHFIVSKAKYTITLQKKLSLKCLLQWPHNTETKQALNAQSYDCEPMVYLPGLSRFKLHYVV